MAEEINVINKIHDLLDRRPFSPFVVVMASGDRYEVTGRHQLAVGTTSIVIFSPEGREFTLRQSQVSAVEPLQLA